MAESREGDEGRAGRRWLVEPRIGRREGYAGLAVSIWSSHERHGACIRNRFLGVCPAGIWPERYGARSLGPKDGYKELPAGGHPAAGNSPPVFLNRMPIRLICDQQARR